MKTAINISLALIFLLTFATSCYKDHGNYDYVAIAPLAIQDTLISGQIYVQQGGTLRLTPQIQLNGNAEDFSYDWFVYLNSASASYVQDSTRISTSKNLDYTVDPNIFTIGEDYKLTYKVTNNRNGLSYYYFYQLTVSDLFTQGWIFLEEKNNTADLSMVLKSGEIYRQIYSFRNADSPIKDPVSFTISPRSISDAVGPDGKKFYIVGKTDAIELDGTTMKKRFDFNYLFFTPPTAKAPSYIAWGGAGTSNLGLLVNNGNLHVNQVGGFPGAKKFTTQLTSPSNGYDYVLAPQYTPGNRINNVSDIYDIIMYDQKNKRFYDVSAGALKKFDDVAINSAVFDMNNVGLDLIKLDSSNVQTLRNAIMKDSGGKGYLLRFKTTRSAEDPYITVSKAEIHAPGIAQALDVVCSTLTPHLFYAFDGKLYRYEVTSDTYKEAFSFGAGETLTRIKFERHGYGLNTPRLVLATWNGVEGKVYYLPVGADGNVGILDKTYTGFGKIIDMELKF